MSEYDRQFSLKILRMKFSNRNLSIRSCSGVVWENEILKMTALKGDVFSKVFFSSYGLPIDDGPGYWKINPEAHSTKSEEVIQTNFIGKSYGEIKASNDVFGDPKRGVRKKLAVRLLVSPKEEYYYSNFTEADCNFCKEVAKDFDTFCVEPLKSIDSLMSELGLCGYYLRYYTGYKQDATGKPIPEATEEELKEYLLKKYKAFHPDEIDEEDKPFRTTTHGIKYPNLDLHTKDISLDSYDATEKDYTVFNSKDELKIFDKYTTIHKIDNRFIDLIKGVSMNSCLDHHEKLIILEKQRRKFLEVWVTKMATKWFYSNMDYFNKDFDHNEKWIPFQRNIIEVFDSVDSAERRGRDGSFKMNILMIWWILRKNRNNIIKLWENMCVSIEKTLINNLCFGLQPLWGTGAYRLQYGGHDHGTIDWKPDAFNISYLKNLVELSRKHIESIIENHKILFGIESTNLSITHTEVSLWKHDRLLSRRLDDHIKNYRALTSSFEEMKIANSVLQRKVETQDELIKGLSEKLDNLIKFFYEFKESVPKEMIRLLLGTIEPLEQIKDKSL